MGILSVVFFIVTVPRINSLYTSKNFWTFFYFQPYTAYS